jgi:hypothetical protein
MNEKRYSRGKLESLATIYVAAMLGNYVLSRATTALRTAELLHPRTVAQTNVLCMATLRAPVSPVSGTA